MPTNQYPILDSLEVRTAEALGIDLEIVEKIIKHKWRYTYDNIATSNSLEDSGLGRFKVRPKKIQRMIEKYERLLTFFSNQLDDPNITEQEELDRIKTRKGEVEYQLTILYSKRDKENGV